ncbi:MAG: RodZ domain-containing protein [Pseudomonadota bacterium]
MARFKRETTSQDHLDSDYPLGDQLRGERATLAKSLEDVENELRIKAKFIDAIENLDVSVFETPGFVSGYVRSYARYLNLDANEVFARFCEEANFEPPVRLESASTRVSKKPGGLAGAAFAGHSNLEKEHWWERLSPAGIASLAVFLVLLGGLAYGGSVLVREIQKVTIAPVPEAPAIAEAGPDLLLNAEEELTGAQGQETEVAVVDQPLAEIYRPELLETPVLSPRDGPIGLIVPGTEDSVVFQSVEDGASTEDSPQVTAATVTGVEVFAAQDAWIQIQSPVSGIIFEQILTENSKYRVPLDVTDAVLRAGNSGSVFLIVEGQAYGPVGVQTRVAKDVELSAETIGNTYSRVDTLSGYDPAATPVNIAQTN